MSSTAEEGAPISAREGEQPLYDTGTPVAAAASGAAPLYKRANLFREIRAKYEWDVYYVGLRHFAVYAVVFAASWICLRGGGSLWWTIPYGWSWYCLLMIGHEAIHYTMAPVKWINDVISVLTMDCLLISRHTWLHTHHRIHHRAPNTAQDRMHLMGDCALEENGQLLLTVLYYIKADIDHLKAHITDVPTLIGLIVRFALLLSLPFTAIILCVMSLLVSGSYFGFLSHAAPVKSSVEHDDPVIYQMRNSYDLFPHSEALLLLSGGLNNHCVHHVFPSLPRSKHAWAADLLRREIPSEYRVIEDLPTLGAMFLLRHSTLEKPLTSEEMQARARSVPLASHLADVLSLLIVIAFLQSVLIFVSASVDFVAARIGTRPFLAIFPIEWGFSFFATVYGDPVNIAINTECNLLLALLVIWMHLENKRVRLSYEWVHVLFGYLMSLSLHALIFAWRRTHVSPSDATSQLPHADSPLELLVGGWMALKLGLWTAGALIAPYNLFIVGLIGWITYIFMPIGYAKALTTLQATESASDGKTKHAPAVVGGFTLKKALMVYAAVSLAIVVITKLKALFGVPLLDHFTLPFTHGFSHFMFWDLWMSKLLCVLLIFLESCQPEQQKRQLILLTTFISAPTGLALFIALDRLQQPAVSF